MQHCVQTPCKPETMIDSEKVKWKHQWARQFEKVLGSEVTQELYSKLGPAALAPIHDPSALYIYRHGQAQTRDQHQ